MRLLRPSMRGARRELLVQLLMLLRLSTACASQHAACMQAAATTIGKRGGIGRPFKYVKAQPRKWEEMVEENAWRLPQGGRRFERLFRMPLTEFEDLVRGIDARAAEATTERKYKGGRKRLVSTSLALAMTLRYLAGGSYLDIMLWARILSHATFYRHVRATLGALDDILPAPSLEADLEDPARLSALAAGFERRSYGKIRGCIGAVDGLLLPIAKPANEVGDGAAKYMTRKGYFAWNVQAVCDADARFTHVSMLCVGSTHDSFAWSLDPLAQRMALGGDKHSSLVEGEYHLVGDEAYAATHTMSVPWTARSCDEHPARLAYNYYQSAARITIERAFGQLTRRWLILKRPYNGRLESTDFANGLLRVLRVCMKLHNRAVDNGTYRKLTYYPTDVTGHPDFAGAGVPSRPNHRGDAEGVAAHTLLSSENKWLSKAEQESAWYPPGHPQHDEKLWDPIFVKQAKKGHTLSDDSAPRKSTTAWMETEGVTRPKRVHWR